MSRTHVRFLGTGASGGTPGSGRSRRRESSLLAIDPAASILIDVTRQYEAQSEGLPAVAAVVLTHGHADASGGMRALSRWLVGRGISVPVFATAATLDVIDGRFDDLVNCELKAFEPETGLTWGLGSSRAGRSPMPVTAIGSPRWPGVSRREDPAWYTPPTWRDQRPTYAGSPGRRG